MNIEMMMVARMLLAGALGGVGAAGAEGVGGGEDGGIFDGHFLFGEHEHLPRIAGISFARREGRPAVGVVAGRTVGPRGGLVDPGGRVVAVGLVRGEDADLGPGGAGALDESEAVGRRKISGGGQDQRDALSGRKRGNFGEVGAGPGERPGDQRGGEAEEEGAGDSEGDGRGLHGRHPSVFGPGGKWRLSDGPGEGIIRPKEIRVQPGRTKP